MPLSEPKPTFDEWIKVGMEAGWVSDVTCGTHDGIPNTDEEDAEWEAGHDPCQGIMRVWRTNDA